MNDVPLNTLRDLKRALKSIGFGVKLKAYSEFTAATYVRLSDRMVLPELFFDEDQRLGWRPLIDFLTANKAPVQAIGKAAGVTGLTEH